MDIGILQLGGGECISDGNSPDINRVSRKLCKHGYFVKISVFLADCEKTTDTFEFLTAHCDAVLICGNTDAFRNAIAEKYESANPLEIFVIDDTPCAVSKSCDNSFISNTLIPMLNSKCKTFYTSSIFKTFGKTEEQLRYILGNFIKNRNKIVFKFNTESDGCTVSVRYSNKTQKNTVSELLSGVTEALKDCTYSYEDVTLSEKTAQMLIESGKTLGLAESFTGGNIAASLVKMPGISKSLKEGIVCYSNEVKANRLRVSQRALDNCGAVSDETAYQMAANLLMDGNYDYVIATTGNAGPTSEKPNEAGLCYIAVGDRHNIDIYCHTFEGDRTEVIEKGTNCALFKLCKLLKSNANSNNANTQND